MDKYTIINRDTDEATDDSNGGNTPPLTSTPVKVTVDGKDEIINILSKEGEDGTKEAVRMEFPESRKDDTEWQKKAKGQINNTAIQHKQNLDKKNYIKELEEKKLGIERATADLKDFFKPSEGDDNFDSQKEIMKELGVNTVEEFMEADKADVTKATAKVFKAYKSQIASKGVSSMMSEDLTKIIVSENSTEEVQSLIQFVKGLGIKEITPSIYQTWKGTRVKKPDKKDEGSNFSEIAGIQAENIPFVPAGQSQDTLSEEQRINKHNASLMVGGLKNS